MLKFYETLTERRRLVYTGMKDKIPIRDMAQLLNCCVSRVRVLQNEVVNGEARYRSIIVRAEKGQMATYNFIVKNIGPRQEREDRAMELKARLLARNPNAYKEFHLKGRQTG